jgi:hypothetical protein
LAGPAGTIAVSQPCTDERRIAAERCDLADRLSEQANAANQVLRDQQRSYDDLTTRAAQATLIADPREIRAAKEAARLAFRRAHAAARSRADGEAAAGDWLTEINRVNQAAREATLEAARARKAAAQLAETIERLSLDADVARINAESAAEACHVAREALAACEEAQVDRRAGRVPVDPAAPPVEAAWPRLVGGPEFETDALRTSLCRSPAADAADAPGRWRRDPDGGSGGGRRRSSGTAPLAAAPEQPGRRVCRPGHRSLIARVPG